jgi:MFS family permease
VGGQRLRALTFGVMIVTGGRLADMFGRRNAGAKLLARVGAGCIAVSPFIFFFSLVASRSSFASLIPGMVVLGVGIGSFYPTATTAGVTSVDDSQTSLAGGIVYMFQIAGGSIGLGLTTTVFSAQPSFVDGMQAAFRLDAALSLIGFLVALFFVGGRLLGRRSVESASA